MLVLASASKARSRLLMNAGISHKVIVSGFQEELKTSQNITDLVQSLAKGKARDVASKLEFNHDHLKDTEQIGSVLGCDSLFEFKGKIFGKPVNKQEAIDRWSQMSSSSGFLHTGHYLLSRTKSNNTFTNEFFSKVDLAVVSTKIYFAKMTDQEIRNYVSTGEPLLCAGGFAIEGKGGLFINSINGCYSNVIGLSLPWLNSIIKT